MKNTDKKTVFYLAWQFARQTGLSFSECLKKAWANIKLKAKMKTSIVEFYYKKINGEIRQAFGTLANTPPTTSPANLMITFSPILIPSKESGVHFTSLIFYLCKNQKNVRKLFALSKIYRTFAVFKYHKVYIHLY